jgi:glycosyltransferase involved in cell wall biosynthesis
VSLAFFTIVTASYLPRARVLAESLRRVHPDARMYVVLAEGRDAEIDAYAGEAGFTPVYIDELDLPRPRHFVWRYDVIELCTAIKPFGFRWLFRHTGADRVIYLDPDILALAPFAPVQEAFESGASLVLTPHLLAPLEDGKRPDDLDILRAGAYNLGFLGVARGPESDAFLAWWGRRLEHHALVDFEAGLFTDQRWIDLVPGMHAGTRICRDPGLNVAYWNLAQRRVEYADGCWRAEGRRLVFFHFSGLDLKAPENLSCHQNRYTLSDTGPVRQLCERYIESVFAAGEPRWSGRPYAWGKLADGTPVSAPVRAAFRQVWDRAGALQGADGEAQAPEDPARLRARDFNQPTSEVPRFDGILISHVMLACWRMHAHLRHGFDLNDAGGQRRFAAWFAARARAELQLPPALIPGPAAAAANRQYAGAVLRAPLPARLRRWGFDLAHRAYLGLPGGAREVIRRHRPPALLRYVREHMMPALHGLPGPMAPARLLHRKAGLASRRHQLAPGLTLIGYLDYSFGLGESARAYARACAAAQVDFDVSNVAIEGRRQGEVYPGQAALPGQARAVALVCVNADGLATLPLAIRARAAPGQYRIGHWYWELEEFPRAWMGSFAEVDELWAASPFIRDALAAVSPCPVLLMPLPVEVRLPRAYTRGEFGLPDDAFLFLFSYDFDSYVARKNPGACIEAFLRAFPPGAGNVGLVIKSQHGERHPQARAAVLAVARTDPRVTVIEDSLTRDQMYGLISVCDSYLSLHRSEGFGLGMAEAMSLGKPVVATGYSGNLAFMRPDNSCLVGYRMVPVREGEYPQWQGQQWAEPDIDEAAGQMRRLVADPALCARIGARARQHMQAHFSERAAGEVVRRRLEAIALWSGSP